MQRAPALPGRRLRIVTGASMGPLIRERVVEIAEATGAQVEVVQVVNEFYGESVTIAGLLGGDDIRRALAPGREGDLVFLPAEALNADRLFIDSVPLAEFEAELAPAEIVEGYDMVECFAAVGGAGS